MRRSARIAALLTISITVAILGGAGGPAAALPREGDPIVVEVTSIEPQNPVPDGTVTLRGTVTNRSGLTVEDLDVLLRVSSEPLGSRSEVASVTDLTTARSGITQSFTLTDVADSLAPSSAAPYSISVETNDLPLGGNGVYAFFVEARSPSVGSFDTAIPITWFPSAAGLQPSRIVVTAPIAAPVDLSANGTLLSPTLTSSMAPGGSLYALAAANATAGDRGVPVSWLVDPAVADAAARLASGSAAFPGTVTDPGAARDVVATWLDAVVHGAAAEGATTLVTPFAAVDASALLDASMPELLQGAIDAAPEAAAEAKISAAGLIAVPPGGNTTSTTLNAYAAAAVRYVRLDHATAPPEDTLSYTPSGVMPIPLADGNSITAVFPDSALTDDLRRPAATPAEQLRMRQGLLADAAMITLELPISARTVVLEPPPDLAMDAEVYAGVLTALAEAPYVELVGLPALSEPDVPTVRRQLQLDEVDSQRLSAAYLEPIPGIEQRLDAFGAVTVDPLAFEVDYQSAIMRSVSGAWRDDLVAGQALLASVEQDLSAEEKKVTTVSTGTVTFSGSSGNLPLTISNDLDQAVEVGVLLQADPAVRLTFTPPDLVLVEAGKRVSIEIPVQIYGSGPLPVSVILTDRDGRPFITTGDLVIQSTAASMIAGAIAIIGAVAFLGLILWRFRRKGAAEE